MPISVILACEFGWQCMRKFSMLKTGNIAKRSSVFSKNAEAWREREGNKLTRKTVILTVVCTILAALALGAVAWEEGLGTNGDVSGQPRAEEYFPAEPGMRWEYEGHGMEYASFVREVLYRDGNLVQIMMENGGTRMAQIYEIADDRVIRRYAEAEVYDDPNLLTAGRLADSSEYTPVEILRMPAETEEWTSPDGSVTSTLISSDAVVETPAGTFEHVLVIRSRHKGSSGEMYEYYAPKVGLVKQEFTSEGYVVTSELVRFVDGRN